MKRAHFDMLNLQTMRDFLLFFNTTAATSNVTVAILGTRKHNNGSKVRHFTIVRVKQRWTRVEEKSRPKPPITGNQNVCWLSESSWRSEIIVVLTGVSAFFILL